MAGRYDHKEIEKKWQKRWEQEGAFAAPENPGDKKLYVLDMFPYPSGEGLHVGHVEGYTATDIYSRYQRMRGKEVLHPIGWDAFGLPAENYAVKTGVHPKETTERAINNFRSQIKRLGLSYDWARELGTHTPEYYRWTQWLFAKFFEKGLVYKKKALVNWDPVDQTVLANEQVLPDGTAERSGATVEKKELEQWFFKITDYADELHDLLDEVDWPESTKIAQRNWIGRSEGAQIMFPLDFKKYPSHNEWRDKDGKPAHISVFTTRPDTLFGATYLVLAPEHPWVRAIWDTDHDDAAENKSEIAAYVEKAAKKSEIDRTNAEKEKTGIKVEGIVAVNPATKEEIPIYIADYVLGGYGTGAIMAVPAHDERDYAFAKKFGLSVRRVIEPKFVGTAGDSGVKEGMPFVKRDAICAIIRNPKDDTYLCNVWKGIEMRGLLTGGVDEGEDKVEAAKREIQEETGYKNIQLVSDPEWIINTFFFHRQKKENRHARFHFLFFDLIDEERDAVDPAELEKHEFVWKKKEELQNFFTVFEGDFVVTLLNNPDYVYTGPGLLGNSGEFDGLESEEAKEKITAAVGGAMKKTYRLRDWLISRQRYWGVPIPIVYDTAGKPHAIPEEHLPWMLPTDVEFKPTGTSPLGQSKELLERTERIFGTGWRPEVDTMDTFACSSWYFLRFADPRNEKEFASPAAMQKWLPVDLYVGGAEHTVLHLLYARFFTKALRDMGYLSFGEPFLKLRHQGIILAEDSRKMSKRWGNVINPDTVVEAYGADTLRLYEMFMGPLEAMKPWNSQNIAGARRFLDKAWALAEKVGGAETDAQTETLLHQTIKKVGDDIEALKMNTAISSLMILSNRFTELSVVPKNAYQVFLQLLAPLAPHLAAELWEKLGGEGYVYESEWPVADSAKLSSATATIAVQVNGKTRATIELSIDATEEEALAAARADEAVAKWLAEGKEEKAIYRPGKILSFVVRKP